MVIFIVTLEQQPAFFGPVPPSRFHPLDSSVLRSILRFLLPMHASQSLLCFHNLTNPFSRSPFPLTTLQNAGGCHPLDDKQFQTKSPNSSPVNAPSLCGRLFANAARFPVMLQFGVAQPFLAVHMPCLPHQRAQARMPVLPLPAPLMPCLRQRICAIFRSWGLTVGGPPCRGAPESSPGIALRLISIQRVRAVFAARC